MRARWLSIPLLTLATAASSWAAECPALLRVFNQGNQATGEQSRALAASVVAYAVLLIDPDAPSFAHVMRRIAYTHVSLGIRPEPIRPPFVAADLRRPARHRQVARGAVDHRPGRDARRDRRVDRLAGRS